MFSGYFCCLLVVFVGGFSQAVTGEIPGLTVLAGPVVCTRSTPVLQVYLLKKGPAKIHVFSPPEMTDRLGGYTVTGRHWRSHRYGSPLAVTPLQVATGHL